MKLGRLEGNLTVQKVVVGKSLNATLASPKSQTFSLQFAFTNIFFGLRSRWYTFAAKFQCSVKLENITHGFS